MGFSISSSQHFLVVRQDGDGEKRNSRFHGINVAFMDIHTWWWIYIKCRDIGQPSECAFPSSYTVELVNHAESQILSYLRNIISFKYAFR